MTDISLIPILRSEGWKVLTRAKMKSMKKEELIETIEMLENNYGATIERANNSYSYGKSEIDRIEKEKQTIIDTQTVEIESRDVYLTEKESIIIRQQTEIQNLKKQNESLKDTLQVIATDTNEHITHNIAQNELDKWE